MSFKFPRKCYRCDAPLESIKVIDWAKDRYAVRFLCGCGGLMSPAHEDDSEMMTEGQRIETDKCRSGQRAKLKKGREAQRDAEKAQDEVDEFEMDE